MPGGRESVPPDASRCVKKCTDHTPKLKIDPEKLCVEDDPFLVDPFGIPQLCVYQIMCCDCVMFLEAVSHLCYLMVSINKIPYQVAVLQIRTLNACTFH